MYKFILCAFAAAIIIIWALCENGKAEIYSTEEINEVYGRVIASPVYGEIKNVTKLYAEASESGKCITADKRQRVLIIKDYSLKWYYVETESEKLWVKADDINIPSDGLTANDKLTDRQIECFINTQGFESKTSRFIWVDIHRQQLYVLKGKKGGFTLEKRITCSTGKNVSPTTRGLFETSDKGEWFYSARLESGAKYWVRFNGSYLLHSVAMDKEGTVTDPVLGVRRSSGCVRTAVKDAKYIYDLAEKGTAIWVN